jgi:hypothetical protein
MHRKLIHSVRALGISLSLLTAVLIVASPAQIPGIDIAADAQAAPAPVEAKATDINTRANHRRAQARAAMALPFFSFAQGLRRGNRS